MIPKRAEKYFYPVLVLLLLTKTGFTYGSISINLGVLTVNDVTYDNIDVLVAIVCASLGALAALMNFKHVQASFRQRRARNPAVLIEANKQLQQTTGNQRDTVSSVVFTGLIKPTANIGSWTSYKSARRDVVVTIPSSLAFNSTLLAGVQTLMSHFISFSLPLVGCVWSVTCI